MKESRKNAIQNRCQDQKRYQTIYFVNFLSYKFRRVMIQINLSYFRKYILQMQSDVNKWMKKYFCFICW